MNGMTVVWVLVAVVVVLILVAVVMAATRMSSERRLGGRPAQWSGQVRRLRSGTGTRPSRA
jgi:flagellar basal body-associated protein FliL